MKLIENPIKLERDKYFINYYDTPTGKYLYIISTNDIEDIIIYKWERDVEFMIDKNISDVKSPNIINEVVQNCIDLYFEISEDAVRLLILTEEI